MLDQRIIELINAGIDGELGPEEQRELEAVLDSSPEAVTFQLELLQLNNAFSNLPELDPPPALARTILDQVQLPDRQKLFKLPGFFAGLTPVAGGLAFAAGLLLAIGFYETGSRKLTQQDTVNMVGTMVASDQVTAPGQGDRLMLDLDGMSGTVSLNVSENGRAIEFDLDSSQLIEIELDLEKAGLVVIGFAQDDRGDGSFIDTLELMGGTMRVVNQGKHHFVVFLRQSPDSENHGKDIRIGISHDGQRVYEDTLGAWR
jgi:hypothetical protein